MRFGDGMGGITGCGEGIGGTTGGSPPRGSSVGYVRLLATELGVRGIFACVEGDRRGVFADGVRDSGVGECSSWIAGAALGGD